TRFASITVSIRTFDEKGSTKPTTRLTVVSARPIHSARRCWWISARASRHASAELTRFLSFFSAFVSVAAAIEGRTGYGLRRSSRSESVERGQDEHELAGRERLDARRDAGDHELAALDVRERGADPRAHSLATRRAHGPAREAELHERRRRGARDH